MIYDTRHFGARTELARLRLRGKDGDLRPRQIIENDFRHVLERPTRMMLEHEQVVLRANAFHFGLQSCRDVASRLVRDDGDPLVLFQSKTNIDRIVRAGDQFRINRIEISSIRHTESCQNYSEIERWQTLWSATLSGSDLSEFHKSHGARDYEESCVAAARFSPRTIASWKAALKSRKHWRNARGWLNE